MTQQFPRICRYKDRYARCTIDGKTYHLVPERKRPRRITGHFSPATSRFEHRAAGDRVRRSHHQALVCALGAGVLLEGDYRLMTFGGNDRVFINNSRFKSKVIVSTGGDDDFIAIDDTAFDERLTIQASKGDDRIEIERSGSPDGKTTKAKSSVQIRSIAGFDHILIGNPFQVGNSFIMDERSKLLIDGGLDLDILEAGTEENPNSNGNRLSRRTVIRGFETIR